MSSSALCHEELIGTSVAILTVMAADSDGVATTATATTRAIFRTDIQPPTLLRKFLIDAIEQHAGTSLVDEGHETIRWVLFRVNSQGLLEQALVFLAILIRHRYTRRQR